MLGLQMKPLHHFVSVKTVPQLINHKANLPELLLILAIQRVRDPEFHQQGLLTVRRIDHLHNLCDTFRLGCQPRPTGGLHLQRDVLGHGGLEHKIRQGHIAAVPAKTVHKDCVQCVYVHGSDSAGVTDNEVR